MEYTDLKDIKMCIDQTIPGQEPFQYIASERSLQTLKEFEEPEFIALVKLKTWTAGRTLRISFLDGDDPRVHKKVEEIASEWLDHANIKFDFINTKDGDIRISFNQLGYWSKLGRDAVATPLHLPTMNFEGFTINTEESEYRRVVIHEFGHALGCIHEHQNPSVNINWNKPVVYDYFRSTQGWDREKVDHNIFRRYSKSITNFSSFDENSIMIYNLPAILTLDNKPIGKRNTNLSEIDKKFISLWYPT